jgi:hypothetical protein
MGVGEGPRDGGGADRRSERVCEHRSWWRCRLTSGALHDRCGYSHFGPQSCVWSAQSSFLENYHTRRYLHVVPLWTGRLTRKISSRADGKVGEARSTLDVCMSAIG